MLLNSFFGDSHGNKLPDKKGIVYHVGDCNVGISQVEIPSNYRFIAGNNDDRYLCKKNFPNYLGDFGYISDEKMFFVSGGKSLNPKNKIIDVNYWPDREQLSPEQLKDAIALYDVSSPWIVLSHEAPFSVVQKIFGSNAIKTETNQALQEMLECWAPFYWIFGHYHRSLDFTIDKTRFICLDKMECRYLPR